NHNVFEAFPENPEDKSSFGSVNLKHSIEYVLRNKEIHYMAVQRYDIRDANYQYQEKYWSPVNAPIFDEQGRLLYIMHRVEDVSDFVILNKKEAEQSPGELNDKVIQEVYLRSQEIKEQALKIEKSESKFRALLEAAPDAMVIAAEDGCIVIVNSQTEKIFGYKRDELLGRKVEILIPARFASRHPEHRSSFASNPLPRAMGTGLELFGLRKDGTEFPVEISLSPLKTKSGTIILSAIRDVSQRKQAELQEQKLKEELSRSNAELQQFAYVAAHDLREPLRTIASYTALLEEQLRDRLDEDAQENLDFILKAARRMQSLIDDLLSFSRVGTQGKAFQSVSIEDIVSKTETILRVPLCESGARLIYDDLPLIFADPTQMEQLFSNLISNAVKFRKPDLCPEIKIKGHAINDEFCLFEVVDNGIGFDMQYADRIFQMFQRLHSMDEYSGTGIGLAICKRIVERHGGRIWVESELGNGSSFKFTLLRGEKADL
ncbi:MAG: PAS domain S-box protein, partial [Candidatus Obscuribacterales bacterium]|nr:PAS domain S-box protein [Candidatus Obscuribacterales bacterium]